MDLKLLLLVLEGKQTVVFKRVLQALLCPEATRKWLLAPSLVMIL